MTDFTDHDGRPLALVTGASSGIGLELAREFVIHGYDVVAAADGGGTLRIPEWLADDGPGQVLPLQVDLAARAGVDELLDTLRAMTPALDAGAINAGIGVAGPFVETDIEDHLRLVGLNVAGAVQLAHGILRDMVRQGFGAVLFTSSIAATMPGPWEATYNASKSFLLSFAEALHVEVQDAGVHVTALMPGPTDTNFFSRAGLDDTKLGQVKRDDPREVARDAFEALMRNDDHVVAGSLKNKAQAVGGKFLPYETTARMHGDLTQPGSADPR
jgi:uncharacterized protein